MKQHWFWCSHGHTRALVTEFQEAAAGLEEDKLLGQTDIYPVTT